MLHRHFSVRVPLILAGLLSTAAAQSLMLQNGQFVQGVGDSVPGLPGVTIGGTSPFSSPVIDLNGTMVWRAKLLGTGITVNVNDQALFYGRSANDLAMFLQRGQAEPSGALPGVTVTYSSTGWDAARLSPQGGWILYGTTLAGTGITTANDSAVYWGQVGIGGQFVLAQEGGPAPSGGSTFSGTISGAQNVTALNSAGTAIIKVALVGGDVVAGVNDNAWLIGNPVAGLGWMCREGDPVAGGFTVSGTLDGFKPVIDEAGRVILAQALTLGTGGVTAADDSTLMLYTPGSGLSVLMREGQPAAGSGGCVYGPIASASGFSNQGFSRTSGRFVFTNTLTGGDVTGNTNDASIFAGEIGGSITRIAREAEAAPTGVPGEIYQALFPNGFAQINESGTVAFVAQLGPTGMSLFSDTAVFIARPPYGPTDVQMILREGQTTPIAGLPAGHTIGNTAGGGMASSSTTLMINERETVLVNVAGVGDPLAATWGVPAQIAWDAAHGARLANMQGEVYGLQVQSSAMGIVATSSGDGGNLSFNHNGDQCSRVFFTGSVPTAILRNRVDALACGPSAVSATLGGLHTMNIDAGVAHAGMLYVVVATASGTRPGFAFGGATIPINIDPLTTESLNNLTTGAGVPWSTTLGLLDGNGRGTATFTMPAGFPQFAGFDIQHVAAVLDSNLNVPYVTGPCGMLLY